MMSGESGSHFTTDPLEEVGALEETPALPAYFIERPHQLNGLRSRLETVGDQACRAVEQTADSVPAEE